MTGIDHIEGLVDDSIENVNKWDPQQIKSGHIELISIYLLICHHKSLHKTHLSYTTGFSNYQQSIQIY